ncbi:hypothetical protein ASD02_18875 [Ensifer sp. Root1252]|nr:hypothetical protein ASD02_18875 [Ensifer sp. Root1252]KRC78683.1 hypothetical protein ASE32_26845 [Ensifer sp. Root231]KRD02586.1 hypothetical protein ASE47_19935 [Ensifer sp. Root258]
MISGLQIYVDGQKNLDHDMLASVNRIDSNGHYEPKNVQLVCQFVNFWKCPQGRKSTSVGGIARLASLAECFEAPRL